MSPPTPVEWSPSKKSRSPASDARKLIASVSRSERHSTNWSSGGIDATNPPMSAALDRGHVDHGMAPHPIRDHRVTGLVHRHGVAFALDVFVVVGQAVLLHL